MLQRALSGSGGGGGAGEIKDVGYYAKQIGSIRYPEYADSAYVTLSKTNYDKDTITFNKAFKGILITHPDNNLSKMTLSNVTVTEIHGIGNAYYSHVFEFDAQSGGSIVFAVGTYQTFVYDVFAIA